MSRELSFYHLPKSVIIETAPVANSRYLTHPP